MESSAIKELRPSRRNYSQLPADGLESDRVDVLVEYQGTVDREVHYDQTLGSNSEGQAETRTELAAARAFDN